MMVSGVTDCRDPIEHAPPERLSLHGQPPSFFIATAKTSATELAFEDAVLIDEVVDDVVLMAVDPTSDGDDE
jgi:hypothetical protein